MKTFLLCSFLATGFLLSCSTSSKPDVPDMIQKRFAAMHPDVKKVTWEMENSNYEAEFELNDRNVTIVFLADGMVSQTETEATLAELPPGVTNYAKESLGGKPIDDASKIVDASGVVTWEIGVGEDDYLFTADGGFLGKENKEPKDTEDPK